MNQLSIIKKVFSFIIVFLVSISLFLSAGTAFAEITTRAGETSDIEMSLKWVTSDPNQKTDMTWSSAMSSKIVLMYSINISTSNVDHAPEEIVVNIPETFLVDKKGVTLSPTLFSLPEHGLSADNMPFSYCINNDGSEAYLEIKNYAHVYAGSNFDIQIGYEIYPSNYSDMSVGKLTATGVFASEGSEPVMFESNELSFTLDTQLIPGAAIKTGKLMRTWDTAVLGEMPGDIDFYNYKWGLYTISVTGVANQDYYLEVTEKPQNNGRVAAIVKGNKGDDADMIQNIVNHGDGSTTFNTKTFTGYGQSGTLNAFEVLFHVAVAYPAYEIENGDLFVNNIDIVYVNADDPSEKHPLSASRTLTWYDYDFSYTGEILTTEKFAFNQKSYTQNEALDFLRLGIDAKLDFWSATAIIQGYDHRYYTVELYDDFMDWQTPFGEMIQMDTDDYEHDNVSISGEFFRVDRITGGKKYYEKGTNSPVVEIWAKRGNSVFELIGSEKVSNICWRSGTSYANKDMRFDLPPGTTQVMARAERLVDHAEIDMTLTTVLKANSPQLREWFESIDDLDSIAIRNYCAVKMYGEEGEWTSKATEDNYSDTVSDYGKFIVGRDHETYGDYMHRDTAEFVIREIKKVSRAHKNAGTISNDPIKRQVHIPYAVGGIEYYDALTLDKIGRLIEAGAFENFSRDSATLYDLLPAGAFLDTSLPVTGYDINSRTGSVDCEVETIDNYRGSGRQMVIFRISMKDNIPNRNENTDTVYVGNFGNNGNGYYTDVFATGFTVRFTATVPWENVAYVNNKTNTGAYQIDGPLLSGGYIDDGSMPTVVNIKDANGVPVFYNLRGGEDGADGAIEDVKNTNYMSATRSINVPTSMSEGLTKLVRANTNGATFGGETAIDTGSRYTYRFALQNSQEGKVSDVIMFDIFESAIKNGSAGGWQGIFDNIDSGYAKLLGIDPVVYYSTHENPAFFTSLDIMTDSIPVEWSAKMPDDKNSIRAIAIDLSTNTNGTAFEFTANQGVYIDINMIAPKDYADSQVTYNKGTYYSKFVASTGARASESIVNTTPVTVRLNEKTPDPVNIFANANKMVRGDGAILEDGQFGFVVLDDAGIVLHKAKNSADGGIVFGPLLYDAETVQDLFIREAGFASALNSINTGEPFDEDAIDSDGEWIFDGTIYKAIVTVSRQGSRLTANISYSDPDGDIVKEPEFINLYHVEIPTPESPQEPESGIETETEQPPYYAVGPHTYKTGDNINLTFWVLAIIACVAAIPLIRKSGKRAR